MEKKTRNRKEFKIHKYEAIIDDGKTVFKVYVPALSEKEAQEYLAGNGEVVRIKEIPEYLPDAAREREDLAKAGYGDAELDLIYRLLYRYVAGTHE